jgi:hypothetical protein
VDLQTAEELQDNLIA